MIANHARVPMRFALLALVAIILFGLDHVAPGQAGPDARLNLDTPIDRLVGSHGREKLSEQLRRTRVGGTIYDWKQYAAWGKELVHDGVVKQPPTGVPAAGPLSTHYRCVHCHNLGREDARLVHPSPDAREKILRENPPKDPEKRDGTGVAMLPGTTLWGAVNRKTFYNGQYAKYHRLKVPVDPDDDTRGYRPMDPNSLADATQVCGRYCSAGRFMKGWELHGILAYLWELELRVRDVDLSPADMARVLDGLASSDATTVAAARTTLRGSYLQAAPADATTPPLRSEGDTDIYADGAKITGLARRGKLLYQSACAGCHGTDVHAAAEGQLIESDKRFHGRIWKGTERDGLYMPFFTSQRLSRDQAADIRAYLRSLDAAEK